MAFDQHFCVSTVLQKTIGKCQMSKRLTTVLGETLVSLGVVILPLSNEFIKVYY